MKDIELLKRIAELNKCPECLGRGHYRKLDTGLQPPDEYTITCPTCNGTGVKLPALNETEWFFAIKNSTERMRRSSISKEPIERLKSSGFEILPAPTLEECLEMLPAVMPRNGHECYLYAFKIDSGFAGNGYVFGYKDDGGYIAQNFCNKSPLTAALKLLEWYLQNWKTATG